MADPHSRAEFGGMPLAMLDVLGASLLQRTVQCMQKRGIGSIAVLSEFDSSRERALAPDIRWFKGSREQLWRYAEAVFNDFAQSGAELIVVARLGPYVQLDFEALLQFHLDHHSRVTRVCGDSGLPLDIFVISASRRNDAAFLFRNMLSAFRVPPENYRSGGYHNSLEGPDDLRRLALDSLSGNTGLEPQGQQVKPGVWTGKGARIHRQARVLAPAYVGAFATVRPLSVITRGSVIERDCQIDFGTVIENSTILANSYVGAGLDVISSVVGFRRIAHLQRHVEVEIGDRRLLSMASSSAPMRALLDAWNLALYMPKAFFAGLRARKQEVPATLPEAIQATPPAISAVSQRAVRVAGTETTEHQAHADRRFATELMATRRYGNE
jgi:hypothetical protein